MRLIAALLLAAGTLYPETKQERGRRVVDEAIAALGGEKFLNVKDRVESGRAYSFYRERLRGLAVARVSTKYLDPAGKTAQELRQAERQTYGKDEDQVVVYPDGQHGYVLTYRGAKPVEEDRVLRYRESTMRNILYLLRMRLTEPEMIFESQGSEVVQNNPTEVVDIFDSENRKVRVWFHRTTKLPFRQQIEWRDPKTKERIEEVTWFAKYRNVEGIQWPFHILRERNGEKVFEMFSEQVEFNKGLAAGLFQLPAGATVLRASER